MNELGHEYSSSSYDLPDSYTTSEEKEEHRVPSLLLATLDPSGALAASYTPTTSAPSVPKPPEPQKILYFSMDNTTYFIRDCDSAFDNVKLSDPRIFGSLVPLGLICLIVICGNMMVIAAVRMTRKLRGATNLFIVSLAWADLMLGCSILPFSAMYEVFSIWIFGDLWCTCWLALDVWTCTTSILHLVTISLDRYIAVTHPITYPNIMTSKRAKMLIVGCWFMSFFICLPPLLMPAGAEEEDEGKANFTMANFTSWEKLSAVELEPTMASATETLELDPETRAAVSKCYPRCGLVQEPMYVIYSSVGSFFIPMFIMMFFNYKIYRTATKTTKAIRQGWTKVKGAGEDGGMGIHRGGGTAAATAAAMAMHAAGSDHRASTRKTSASLRVNNSVTAPSSRRPSTALTVTTTTAGGAGASTTSLRRQATIATSSGGESRTLPRSTVNGRIKNSVTCNGGLSKAATANGGSTTNLLTTKVRRRLSASTNSLHVPDASDLRRGRSSETLCSTAGSPSPSTFRKKSLLVTATSSPNVNSINSVGGNGAGNKGNGATSNKSNGRPRLSNHQPCHQHIMGKTFAEQGTQTLKMERSKGQPRPEIKPTKRRPFRWRAKKQSVEIVNELDAQTRPRAGSPCSIDEGRLAASGRPRIGSCFHFKRWRHGLRMRGKANGNTKTTTVSLHGGDSPPGSGDELLTGNNVPAIRHGGSSGTVNSLGTNAAVAAAATKFGKRNIKSQVRRFRMETKAAKTLGIIVGCFICCWFPFFTMYLITAFCIDCIPNLAFSIIFWLGYCNSAINPFIYAAFSREFRNAFKKILCKFLCNRRVPPQGSTLARMGLPFAPQTVAIGLADRFPLPVAPGNGASSAANDNLESTTSSNRTSTVRKNSLRP